MRGYKKILALAFSAVLLTPSISHASEIVRYDDSNLDDVLVKNGISVDTDKVSKRRQEEIKENTKEESSEEIVEDIKEEKPKLYPKTAVYSNVVDMSEHQKPESIDYDKFAKDIDGAILRSSITTFNEDKKTKKKTYYLRKDYAVDTHYENLNKRNVPIGFYHYSRAINEKEAAQEANFVLDYIRGKNISLPIFMDIEDNMRQTKANRESLSNAASTFLNIMERNGYVAGIYSYPYYAKNHLSKEIRNRGNFWIADYEGVGFTGYTDTDFDSWQYTHTGRSNGYKGNLDKNILYKDYPLMITGRSRKSLDKIVDEVIEGHWSFGRERQRRLSYAGYDYGKIQKEVNRRLSL